MKYKIFIILLMAINIYLFSSKSYAQDYTVCTSEQEVINEIYYILTTNEENAYFYCNYMDNLTIDDVTEYIYKAMAIDNESIYDCEAIWGNFKGCKIDIKRERRGVYISLNIEYQRSKEELLLLDIAIKDILKSLELEFEISKLSDIEKAKIVHDYLIKIFDYDTSLTNIDDFAGIYNGNLMICQGYSLLYAKLLNSLDVKCTILISKKHSWNAVFINNEWYQVDVTNDDLGHLGITKILHNNFMKKKLIGTQYAILTGTDIFTYNDDRLYKFNNISNKKDVILYRLKQSLFVCCIVGVLVFLVYSIFVIFITLLATHKRKKCISDFDNYNSI